MLESNRPSWRRIAALTGTIAFIVMCFNRQDSPHPETMRNAPYSFGSMLIATVCTFALRGIEGAAPAIRADSSNSRGRALG